MLPHREKWLKSRGVDTERIEGTTEYMKDKAAHLVGAYKHLSGKNLKGQGFVDEEPIFPCIGIDDEADYCRCVEGQENPEDCLEEGEMTPAQKKIYAEMILMGIVDGIVAYFSFNCHAGLISFISSVFRMVDHYEIWLPQNTMKFTMSMNSFLEASNVVFAYCDVTHFQHEIEKLTEYQNWEQYV